MLNGLNISNRSSISSALVLENKNDLIPEGKPVSIGKTLEACWLRELHSAYTNLVKRFIKRTLFVFAVFVGSVFLLAGLATASDSSVATYRGSSTSDSGVTCDRSSGCRYYI